METKPKILCIDDEEINLYILKRFMGEKYEIITSNEPHEALRILEQDGEIELIITDMHMPLMNGLEFAREAQKRFENKKIFMLSGFAMTSEIQNALDSGLILDYFSKPADFVKIHHVLEQHTGQ